MFMTMIRQVRTTRFLIGGAHVDLFYLSKKKKKININRKDNS
jgi:hypothetical protein